MEDISAIKRRVTSIVFAFAFGVIILLIASFLYLRSRSKTKDDLESGLSTIYKKTEDENDENSSGLGDLPTTAVIPKPIAIDEFANHVEKMEKRQWKQEFQMINFVSMENEKELGLTQTEGSKADNKDKNRFESIIPYDTTRVVLKPLSEYRLDETETLRSEEYINASFVTGEKGPREFIVTESPTRNTVDNFWRMVWEQETSLIVMLTKTKEKEDMLNIHYWPKENMPLKFGLTKKCVLKVSLISTDVENGIATRHLKLEVKPNSRDIKHIHFPRWPNNCIPEWENFYNLVKRYKELKQKTNAPVVVHCGAGVGRSGTFISIDRLLKKLKKRCTHLDVFSIVIELRKCRPMMVYNYKQYRFIYTILADTILTCRAKKDELTN